MTAATVLAGWQRALAAQHAAVYGYGLVGSQLTDPVQQQLARTLEAGHRSTRDALMAELAAAGVPPVAPNTDYEPPAHVTGQAAAQRWALALEEGCAAGYRSALALTATSTTEPAGASATPTQAASPVPGDIGAARMSAITGLTAAAAAAARWRAILSPSNPTVALPGT